MRVFTFLRVAEPESAFQQVADSIAEIAALAAKEKITLLVEDEGACNVVTCKEIAAFMKLTPQKNVGINWDPMNGIAQKEAPFPDGYALLPKNRIQNVQFKGKTLLEPNQKLDWGAILETLVRDGYKGYAGLETHYLDGTDPEKAILCVQEFRSVLESCPHEKAVDPHRRDCAGAGGGGCHHHSGYNAKEPRRAHRSGSEVRTHQIDAEHTIVLVDTRIDNPSTQQFVVRDVEVFVEEKDGKTTAHRRLRRMRHHTRAGLLQDARHEVQSRAAAEGQDQLGQAPTGRLLSALR